MRLQRREPTRLVRSALVALGLLALASQAAYARPGAAYHPTVVVMPRAYWGKGVVQSGNDAIPVGTDNRGDIWEYVTGTVDSGAVVRYDPTTKRFLHGFALTEATGNKIFISPTGQSWSLWQLEWKTGVVRSQFAPSFFNPQHDGLDGVGTLPVGQVNDMAVDGSGTAWLGGWSSKTEGYRRTSGRHAKGLPPAIPPGRAALFSASADAANITGTAVPVRGPITGVTIDGSGHIWLMDPFPLCAGRGHSACLPAQLARYDPANKTFKVFAVPARDDPEICIRSPRYRSKDALCDIFARTSMSVAPDGAIWTVIPTATGTRILRFKAGRFTRFDTRVRFLEAPGFDPGGNAWLSQRLYTGAGRLLVLNPSTGAIGEGPFSGGSVIQGHGGRLLYIELHGVRHLS